MITIGIEKIFSNLFSFVTAVKKLTLKHEGNILKKYH